MRTVVAILEVDDDREIEEKLGTIDYIEKEFGWLKESGIFLGNARILDDDDKYDANAIALVDKIFNEGE